MAKEEQKKYSSWTATAAFLENFGQEFKLAQMNFKEARHNRKALSAAFANINEIYRMEAGYLTDKEQAKLEEAHKKLRFRLEKFSMMSDSDQNNNYPFLFHDIDDHFTKLTTTAIQKNLFPSAKQAATFHQKLESGRQL